MRLLVIGGTRFLGRHLVQQALDAGHRVTLLHRGRSQPGLFPQAEHRHADRNGDLSALDGGSWDSVVDTCAYVPRHVRAVAERLAGRVGHYQIVSTISVYAATPPGADETAPRVRLDDPTTETIIGDTYGGLKVLCEDAAEQAFPGRCLRPRPALLVGPHDPTGRFTWWVQRFAGAGPGDRVLAPGRPEAPVQFIDARDAAAWMLRQAQAGTTGAFNLTGPDEPLTMGGLVEALRSTLAPAARPEWVDEAFLAAQGVSAWSDLPVWLDRAQEDGHRLDARRARATGLHCRPLRETLADIAAWVRAEAPPAPAGVGLGPEREARLLRDWREHGAA